MPVLVRFAAFNARLSAGCEWVSVMSRRS